MAITKKLTQDFLTILSQIKNRKMREPSQARFIFQECLSVAGLLKSDDKTRYEHIYDILDAREFIHTEIVKAGLKEDVSVVGGVTELICETALSGVLPDNRFGKLPQSWKWIGDFAIVGIPFNLFISVKSYKAKERLLVSGTGQNAAPVVGFGLFDDVKEWSPDRVKQYKQRGFLAIYMPKNLYDEISNRNEEKNCKYKKSKGYPATSIVNIYDRPLLRKIEDFADDVSNVCNDEDVLLDLSKF